MKKLLVVLTKLKTPHNGLWEVAFQFGNHLIDVFDFNQWEVTFLVPKNHPFTSNKVKYKRALLFYKFFARFWNYDVVHAIDQNNRYLRSKNKHTQYITTIHDLNYLYEKLDQQQTKYHKRYQKNIKGNSHLVCISEHAKEDLTTQLNTFDIPISVIYNGVIFDPQIALQKPKNFPNKKQNCKILFFISTFMRKKNIHSIVNMMSKLPDYKLIIAGKIIHSDYFEEVENLIYTQKLSSQIHYIGTLTESEKHYCYEHCDAFVFPSIAEGFGIPPIEAMLHGKTVFASTCTSLPEICGNMAWYWENFDAKYMAEIVREKLELQNVPQNNPRQLMEYAKKYDWTSCVKQYIDLYEAVIQ